MLIIRYFSIYEGSTAIAVLTNIDGLPTNPQNIRTEAIECP